MGIDIGGSAIKVGVVDLSTGRLTCERRSIPTPQPAAPAAVGEVVGQVVRDDAWTGLVGVTFPGVIKGGVARTAANVDPSWIGTDADALFSAVTGCDVTVLNDADAAGLAEMRFGAGRGARGVVIMITLGTGVGSALFIEDRLVPNTELGHVELDAYDAERRAAASVKDREGLSYAEWGSRVQNYLRYIERLFTPDLFIVGGGVSKDAREWLPMIKLRTPVKAAELLNDAGIVGAAVTAVTGPKP
jgi:polyphosphate glucokinase